MPELNRQPAKFMPCRYGIVLSAGAATVIGLPYPSASSNKWSKTIDIGGVVK
jgi:hypothetical protein